MTQIRAVWVEVGCIGCQSCANCLPAVFSQPEDRAEILGSVRVDGQTSHNETEKSDLNDAGQSLHEEIIEAAEGCPVEAIKYSVLS